MTRVSDAMRRRYLNDVVFHRLVDGIRSAMRADIISPADVADALALAESLNQEDDDRRRVRDMLAGSMGYPAERIDR